MTNTLSVTIGLCVNEGHINIACIDFQYKLIVFSINN